MDLPAKQVGRRRDECDAGRGFYGEGGVNAFREASAWFGTEPQEMTK